MTRRDPFSDESIESAPNIASELGIPSEPGEVSYEAQESEVPDTPEESETVEEAAPPVEGETPAETAERLFAGKYKPPDELEKGYESLHSLLGRKEAAYKEQLRQQEELMEQLLATEYGQHQQSVNAPADVESFAMERPDAAMAWAVEENRGAVPDVLAAIESVNPRLAREYELAYTQMLAEERMAAHTAPLVERMQAQQQAMEVQRSFEAFRRDLGDDYEVIKDELPKVIEEYAHLAEQMEPAQFLNIMGNVARGRSVPRIEQAVQQREQAETAQRRLAAAETGSAPVAHTGEPSEEDQIKAAMFGTQVDIRKYLS